MRLHIKGKVIDEMKKADDSAKYHVLADKTDRKEKERDESTRGTDSGDREIQERESR